MTVSILFSLANLHYYFEFMPEKFIHSHPLKHGEEGGTGFLIDLKRFTLLLEGDGEKEGDPLIKKQKIWWFGKICVFLLGLTNWGGKCVLAG